MVNFDLLDRLFTVQKAFFSGECQRCRWGYYGFDQIAGSGFGNPKWKVTGFN